MATKIRNQHLRDLATGTLLTERPMTLRQLFYRCVSAGALQNSHSEYRRLATLMTRLRRDGDIPRSWLVDHVRATLKPSSWTGLADFGETVRNAYRRDYWASLPACVEVLCEKDAVAGTLQPVTAEYDVSLRVCRGFASISFVSEIAETWAEIRKPIYAYYAGDFDPSGWDIERDLRSKLAEYSGREIVEDELDASSDTIYWQRVGVMEEDFDLLDLVELPVKKTDGRSREFIRRHGHRCAEIDAIPPNELRRRLRQAITGHIDATTWARLEEVERLERDTLAEIVAGLDQET